MRSRTPQHIRQHFDMAFRQVEAILKFQLDLNRDVNASAGDLNQLADVFYSERFLAYKQFILMMPRVERKLNHYSSYFHEHFPTFRRELLTPSLRVHFYSLVLKSLKGRGSRAHHQTLDRSIEFLDQVNRRANTEMTVSTVVDCPVDLRLAGDLLLVDEFYYESGPLPKMKYTLVLFQHLVLFTQASVTCFRLVHYFRPGQVASFRTQDGKYFLMDTKPSLKRQLVRHVFRPKTQSSRHAWQTSLSTFVPRCVSEVDRVLDLSRTQHDLLPLSLTSEYPYLQEALALTPSRQEMRSASSRESHVQILIAREENYIYQLSNIIHEEEQSLPGVMVSHLEELLTIHCKKMLPRLKNASILGLSSVLACFHDMLDDLAIYSQYLAVSVQISCLADARVSNGDPAAIPVGHFAHYLIWFASCGKVASNILERLHELAKSARTRLLTDAILDSRVDFSRSGKVLRCDTVRVSTPHPGVKDGVHQALLFTDLIILAKLRPPFYEYICDIRLDEVNLGPLTMTHPSAVKVEVRRGGGRSSVAFVLRCNTQDVRDAWLAHLTAQFRGQAETIKRQTSITGL